MRWHSSGPGVILASLLLVVGLAACSGPAASLNGTGFSSDLYPSTVTAQVGQVFSATDYISVQPVAYSPSGTPYSVSRVELSDITYEVEPRFQTTAGVIAVAGPASHSPVTILARSTGRLDDPPPAFRCLRVGTEDFEVVGKFATVIADINYTDRGSFRTAGEATCEAAGTTTTASTSVAAPGTTTTTAAPPIVSPIEATFLQSAYSTYYQVKVSNLPGATFKWSVSIPSDPGCASGFQPGVPNSEEATWYHKDEAQGGPCNHGGQSYSEASGHPGAVTVVVTAPHLSCRASYFGTLTGRGSPPQCTRS